MTARPPLPPVRDAKTGAPLPPRKQPGYFPGHSTMAQETHWDEATARTVRQRLEEKPLGFFTADEAPVLQAILDCVMPQGDRDPACQIPVLALIDRRLHGKKFDGYIYEGTPEDDVAHRLGLHAVEALAQHLFARSFAALDLSGQETILLSIQAGKPALWSCGDALPPKHYWYVLLKDAATAYYSHPFAWDEIGYGGPAYPRGYMRLTDGRPEPWEKDERRYEWLAPDGSRSDRSEPSDSYFAESHRAKSDAGAKGQ